jgi:HK97 family phage major capsid protein
MANSRTRDLSFSSEYPYKRWFGTEILDHDPKSVRMDFMKSGRAPLLMSHDQRDVIGIIEKASIDGKAKVGRASARFGRSAQAEDKLRDVDDGILVNVSTGYRVHEMVLEKANDTEDTYRVTDWEPLEASLVGIPADPSVGIGRAATVATLPVSTQPALVARSIAMTEQVTAPAGQSAETETRIEAAKGPSAMEIENARVRGIENLCKANGIDDGIKSRWVSGGTSIEQVTEDLLAIIKSRGEKTKTVAHVGLSPNEVRRYSLARAIRACADQNWSGAGFEAEVSQEIGKKLGRVSDKMKFYVPAEVQQRDLTVGTTTAGGFLVGTDNQSFIDILRNTSVAMRMGTMTLSGLVGSVTVPKQTAAATNFWLSTEATAITESQQTFAQMALSPKTAGAYTEISRQLLLQSSPAVEGLVQSDLAQVVALAVDLAVLNGSGASGQPTGIISTAGIGSVTGTSIAYAGIVEFQTDTATGNALFDSSGYVTTPAVAGLLKQRVKFTSTASPIWEGKLLEGTVDGYRAMASNQVPSANILFGDFSKVVLAEWGVLEVEVNPYANFAAGIVGVRAMYSIDVGVRYPAAFSLATAVT